MKKYILSGVTLLILGIINFQIIMKEENIKSGNTMLLRLAPVDPRSLMQGDYMVLRYAMARDVGELDDKGCLVVSLDMNKVASYRRIYKGGKLEPGEFLLKYRNRNQLRIGAESFFFQEGHGKTYSNAAYGELKVDASGNSVLIGLRDSQYRKLGTK